MKRKIHVVAHTHWDREWYFTTSRSKVYLMNNLKNIMHTLKKDEKFTSYMLDAQASLLDDYLKWMPQDEQDIRHLIETKRLMVGPWYTQSDQMVISAESIVRNLYYGIKRCEQLGGYMNVAYVPDSFGQAGNMPQIYQSFGLKDTLFWRGVSDDMCKHTDFMWRGDDGSKVFATQIPFGYYIGGPMPESEPEASNFWESECFEKAGSRSSTKHIYFPHGFDQAPIRPNLAALIQERANTDTENEYIISSLEQYIKEVKQEQPILEEVQGELLNAKHMRIHKSIFSSRSDLKQENTQLQNYLCNVVEPMLSMSYALGNEYPKGAMEDVWKLMFENAAHDSIGSCISDTANQDVHARNKQVKEIATNLMELHSRLIATHIQRKQDIEFTMFNTLTYPRTGVAIVEAYVPSKDFALLDANGTNVSYSILHAEDQSDYVTSQCINLNPSKPVYIPATIYKATLALDVHQLDGFGYQQYSMVEEYSTKQELQEVQFLENEYYHITCNVNGSFDVLDKENNTLYKQQLVLEENGDDGDSFNYSPPREDLVIRSTSFASKTTMLASSIYQQATTTLLMVVPKDLSERAQQRASVVMPITIKVALHKGDRTIHMDVACDNTVDSHRLCALFDSQLVTQTNYADQQFGSIVRPNVYEEDWNLYNQASSNTQTKSSQSIVNFSNNMNAWQEPPISIETMQSYVALFGETRGIAVFPQGVREYEIIQETTSIVRLTLFRTYGHMGKENLLYRPGRASGERIIETPDAQLRKKLMFSFGWSSFQSDFNHVSVAQEAKKYDAPIQSYESASFLNGRLIFAQNEVEPTLNRVLTLFESKQQLVVSTIKKAEVQDGYIIRLYNPLHHQECEDSLTFTRTIKDAYYVNLKEDKIEKPLRLKDDTIFIQDVGHCEFVSLFVSLN